MGGVKRRRGACLINRMQNTVHYMRFGKGADCAAVAMLVNEALSPLYYLPALQQPKQRVTMTRFSSLLPSLGDNFPLFSMYPSLSTLFTTNNFTTFFTDNVAANQQ